MGRTLLNDLPTWLLAVLFVGGMALVALAGALLVRRFAPRVAAGNYAATGHVVITNTLAIYALVLAFVIVNQYTDHSDANTDVQSEALNVEDLYRVSLGFEEPTRKELATTIKGYVHAIVEEEWDELETGDSSPRAAALLDRMYVLMRTYSPQDGAVQARYDASLGFLHSTHEARHRRLNSASDTLPPMLAAFLIVGALASLGATYLLGLERNQLLIPIGLGALLGFTLLLSLTLEHPFSGPDAITSHHFREGALARLFD